MNLAFVGYGAFGKQLEQLASFAFPNHEAIYLDDLAAERGTKNAFPFESYADDKFANYQFIVGLGYKHLQKRCSVIKRLLDLQRNLPSLIHPSSYVNHTAQIQDGVVIMAMGNVDANTTIEAGVVLNNSCTVSHDSTIGESSFLGPGAVICGNVKLGGCSFVGSGAVVVNGVNIAGQTTIGAGTVVSKDIQMPGQSVIGNPMRILDRPLLIA